MSVSVFSKTGVKSASTAKLDKSVFGLEVESHHLLQEAYTMYLANGRRNLAVTKTRGLVSGGGRKPWKQKGTGRARFGSSRNPIWRGGGIAFGPTGEENYSKQMNLKAKRLAIRQALSLQSKASKLIVLEALEVKTGKTADLAKFLKKISATGNTLIVVGSKTPELVRAATNIQNVKVIAAKYLNVFDTLNADHIVFTQEALAVVNDWLAVTPTTKAPVSSKVNKPSEASHV
jgi:large subunit ribosomal protein L4